ncbi:hypothetical protein ABB37_08429 [Leptomonas pyrrhocoris]|uniref:Uncharacterized protein n=1 Tax=Leptomonas pyrrhocoris TaxID=157538 RepID=A0A0M9FTC5_LEPPY|nr:hypothetical protein ABB37_08429 [Leptomonas pyrrhocoris]KPA75539.1 hypothetical protein ABB37_08429 [Leptomonas pyrrhocoris]|eukprot:XP_015653978.1 hypothetical protein ABB37_08429 [Leptomonas pyrrhocoris]
MTCLVAVCVAVIAGYVLLGGFALFFLVRFAWLNCVREARPRQCGQHLLSYGVLLCYLVLCVWTAHGSAFLQSGLRLAASSSTSASHVGTGSAFGASSTSVSSRWPVRVLVEVGSFLADAFLRPWTPFSLAAPATTAHDAALSSSAPTLLFCSALCAFAQVVAATSLYGTFAVWCNTRWRYVVLRTVAQHADLWALLFPLDPAEDFAAAAAAAAAMRFSAEVQHSSQHQRDGSMDSLSSPPSSPAAGAQRGAAGRRTGRVSVIAPANASPRTPPGLPRFNASGSSRVNAAANGRVFALSQRPDRAAGTMEEEETRPERQRRRHLLRVRQRFLSAFWVTDATVLLMTFFFFSSLAAGRVAVTAVMASIWTQRFSSGAASSTTGMPSTASTRKSFTPYPTEGYVAVIGLCYLALLRLRLRRQRALLRDLFVLVRSSATATATAAAPAAPSPSLSPLPLPRQRRSRLLHGAEANSSRTHRSSRCRLSRSSGSLSSPASPTHPLCSRSFDNAPFSGWVTVNPRPPLQRVAFDVDAEDRATRVKESGGRSASLFARWGVRWWSWSWWPAQTQTRASRQEGGSSADASSSTPSATSSPAAAVQPNPPKFRFLILTTAALLAVQLAPDSTGVWAAALGLIGGCAAGTTRDALCGPFCWIVTDYRKLLRCSWWGLFASRACSPRAMDVSAAISSLSEQQRRHFMTLHIRGALPHPYHRRHPSCVVVDEDEEEDWVAETANKSFAVNALVEAAKTATVATITTNTRTRTMPTPDFITSPRSAGSASTTSPSASSATTATAAACLGDVGDVDVDALLADDDAPGMSEVGGDTYNDDEWSERDSVVAAFSLTQFWHGVVTQALQKSAAQATGLQGAPSPGLNVEGGALHESFEGPASTTHANSSVVFPSLPGLAHVPHGGSSGGGDASITFFNASFLGVTDPFRVAALLSLVPTESPVNGTAKTLLPIAPGLELGHDLRAGFGPKKMKRSMLLTAPAAARVGAAEERGKEDAAERARQVSAAAAAAVGKENNEDHPERNRSSPRPTPADAQRRPPLSSSPPPPHAPHAKDHAIATAPEAGWLSSALATVVSVIVGHRRSVSSPPLDAHAEGAEEAFTSALPAEVVHDMSTASSLSIATSAAARALQQSEEGFERFLSCVRRDGDNTFALQSMLSAHGNTYGSRVDAMGRGALHYAVIGGFVHGVWFLVKIGAEPNLLDKAGYAPLHYAVLYHTVHRLSPTITDENTSATVRQARQMLGIPVVATAALQAPEQARKRRQLRQQRHRRLMRRRLQAAYSATTDPNRSYGGSSSSDSRDSSDNGRPVLSMVTSMSTVSDVSRINSYHGRSSPRLRRAEEQHDEQSHHHHGSSSISSSRSVANSTPLGIPSSSHDEELADSPLLELLPTDMPDDPEDAIVEEPASSMAVVAAAAMAQEERGQWYGLVGRLLSLGALVDFPTARGLTALHLAVLQGALGLVNTLLREGANPLLGSELETRPFLSPANDAAGEETEEDGSLDAATKAQKISGRGDGERGEEAVELDRSAAWTQQVNAELQRAVGGRRRRRRQEESRTCVVPGEEEQAEEETPYGAKKRQKGSASWVEAPSPATSPPPQGTTSVFDTEWVDVHLTHAGSPIVMGHCKSPLLLAVELDADLVVASMLYHATVQDTYRRVAASLRVGKVKRGSSTGSRSSNSLHGSGGGGRGTGHVSFLHDGDVGVPFVSSASNSPLPPSPVSRRVAHGSPVPSPLAVVDLTNTTDPLQQQQQQQQQQRPPLVPSPSPTASSSSSRAVTPGAPSRSSVHSRKPSLTTAVVAGRIGNTSPPAAPGSAHPLMEEGGVDEAAHNNAAASAAAVELIAAVAALLPSPTVINTVGTSSNRSSPAPPVGGGGSGGHHQRAGSRVSNSNSVTDLISSVSGATADTIATTITTLASTWVRTCWARSCEHDFRAIHVALLLGNARAARVLLLRWTYDGNVRGGGGGGSAVLAAAGRHHTTSGVHSLSSGPTTPSRRGRGGGEDATLTSGTPSTVPSPAVSPPSTSLPSSSADRRDTASTMTTTTLEALPSTVAQITVPVHDKGEGAVFAHRERSSNGSGGSSDDEGAQRGLPSSSPRSRHHHHHHRGHRSRAPSTAMLSLATSTGASAFWVVPLRLNFFHLAAIGDSTECLAYVLRWSGVPDYVPCALSDAFHDEAQAEELRWDVHANVGRLAATETQDAEHCRGAHHGCQKWRDDPTSTREPTSVIGTLPPFTAASPVLTEGIALPTATTTTAALSNAEELGSRTNIVVVSSVLESLRTSSSNSGNNDTSRTRTGGAATAAPTLRRAGSASGGPQPSATAALHLPVLMEEPPPSATLPPAHALCRSSSLIAEVATRRDGEAVTGSDTLSDVFNRTWSSSRSSLNSVSSNEAQRRASACPGLASSVLPRRALRLRAMCTLLQSHLQDDGVRWRVRTTVFGRRRRCGSSAPGAMLRPRATATTRTEEKQEKGDTEGGAVWDRASLSPSPSAAAVGLASEQNSVLANTCFGSTAAAAALHTGMTICYATMNNLVDEEEVVAEEEPHRHTDSVSSSTCSSASSNPTSNEGSGYSYDAQTASGTTRKETQSRVKRHHRQVHARRLREHERLRRLHQQRRRAFVSAVTKLRQCIVHVPLDVAHLAAIEMAVDRACTTLPSAPARRSLQQALLIVTRRLQNQKRRQQLIGDLRRSAATAAARSGTTPSAVSARQRSSTDDPAHDSEAKGTLGVEDSFAGNTATISKDSHPASSFPSTPTAEAGTRRRGGHVNSPRQDARSPSIATSAPSYYSALGQYTEGESNNAGEKGGGDFVLDERWRRFRHEQQQQRLRQLLTALASELNAVDTRGLTPLHYAIANQNAGMVYLLCAYGATFVFASEETESQLVGRSVKAVAAEAAMVAALEDNSSNSNGTATFSVTSGSDSEGSLAASMVHVDGAPTVSPMMASTVIVSPTGMLTPARSEKTGTTAPAATRARTTAAALRAQLADSGIVAAADILARYSEHYAGQLTPATREALRQAAKAARAEPLLRHLPTREAQEGGRLDASHDGLQRDAPPRVGTSPLQLHSTQPPIASTTASATPATTAELGGDDGCVPATSTTVAVSLTTPPPSTSLSSSLSAFPQLLPPQRPPPLTQFVAPPSTIAATLTEALGLGVSSIFAVAAAGALRELNVAGQQGTRESVPAVASASSTPTPQSTMAAPTEAAMMASRRNKLHDLQAHLVEQEERALQQMVGGARAVSRCNNNNNSSVATPLLPPPPTASSARARESTGEEKMARGNTALPSPAFAATPTGDVAAAAAVESAVASSGAASRCSAASSPSAPATATAATAAADAQNAVEYAMLEPHDVFVTHVVRNPAKADSMVRAAMEGTALRYLFQAYVVTSTVGI